MNYKKKKKDEKRSKQTEFNDIKIKKETNKNRQDEIRDDGCPWRWTGKGL